MGRSRLVIANVLVFVIFAALFMNKPNAGQFEDGHAAFERKDYSLALKLWKPLAEAGHAKAQLFLGAMYMDGHGVPQDDAETEKWYRKAAEQGLAEAEYILGYMYEHGISVPLDRYEASRWYRKAAQQSVPEAQLRLSKMYFEGLFVKRDIATAYMWLKLAALGGSAKALEDVDMVAEALSAEELARAQKMIREWQSSAR